MSRSIRIALGGRPTAPVPVARDPLYAAIDRHLHPGPSVSARTLAGWSLGAALSLALLPADAALAATITVDSTTTLNVAGDGLCELPEAVANANAIADTTGGDCAAGELGLDTIAFDGALAASTIALNGEIIYPLEVTDALSIDGSGAPELVIDGVGHGMLYASAPLSISHLVLQNGNAPSGGAIYASDTLTIANTTMRYNSAKYGGAVTAMGGLLVEDSGFYENEAAFGGGAIFSPGDTVIRRSAFAHNESELGDGGAVLAGAQVEITDSAFYANTAASGGALQARPVSYAKGAPVMDVSIASCDFVRNTAYGNDAVGGAVAVYAPDLNLGLQHSVTIASSVFAGNQAGELGGVGITRAAAGAKGESGYSAGGAVFVAQISPSIEAKGDATDALSVDIDDSGFEENFAFFGGGVALMAASTVTIDESTFDANVAFVGGGALITKYSKYGPSGGGPREVTLTGSTFSDNGAALGGGLLAGAHTLTASGMTFTGNVAGSSYSGPASAKGAYLPTIECSDYGEIGGAALIARDALMLADSNLFSGNCAGYVGGVRLDLGYGGVGSVSPGTVIDGNVAESGIGGVDLDVDDEVTFRFEGTVTGNGAGPDGAGGMHLEADELSTVDIANATFSGNTAAGPGGGLRIADGAGTVRVERSTLSGNTASIGGGVLVMGATPVKAAKGSFTGTVELENVTVHGNTAQPLALPFAKGLVDGAGGGIAVQGTGNLTIDFGTITGNQASGDGGGLWADFGASIAIANSIIAENTAGGVGDDISGEVEADYTLVQSTAGATVVGSGNDLGTAPMLGALQDNGGPTLTRLPQSGSPVIGTGDPGFVPPPDTDQRGVGFPRVNGVVDKGAVEVPSSVVALSIDPESIAEGAQATLTVTLDGTTGQDALVTIEFSGTAIAGTDFTAGDDDAGTAGTQVLVPAGSSTGDILVSASTDGIDEPDEPFTATATAATGADIAGVVADDAIIVDGDPTPGISIADASAAETDGAVEFAVSLSGPSSQVVDVAWATSDGTALAGQDYTASAGTLSFAVGETTGTVSVPLAADAVDEPDESFVVELSAPVNATLADGQATGTIVDANATPVVTLSLGQSTLIEESGATQITATLSAPSAQDVVVTLAFSGSATLGTDYSVGDADAGAPGVQIVIPAGSLSASIPLTTIDDEDDEGDETIVVDIASVLNATESGAQQVTATIDDSADAAGIAPGTGVPPPVPQPAIIPTLSEWMLMLLALLLPATVMTRLRGRTSPARRRH